LLMPPMWCAMVAKADLGEPTTTTLALLAAAAAAAAAAAPAAAANVGVGD
jgi:hypothetical protein